MSYTVLFVDDEPDLTEICCEIFSMEGFQVLAAESGTQALDILSQKRVDVIVSDAKMPNMGGIELLEEVRALGQKCLFYLATGMVEVDEEKLQKLGSSGIISKPYNVDDLLEKVRKDLVNLTQVC